MSDEAKEKGYIIWCYEGTIEEVHVATNRSEKKFSITTKHAAARILWDREFNDANGARVRFDFMLNPQPSQVCQGYCILKLPQWLECALRHRSDHC